MKNISLTPGPLYQISSPETNMSPSFRSQEISRDCTEIYRNIAGCLVLIRHRHVWYIFISNFFFFPICVQDENDPKESLLVCFQRTFFKKEACHLLLDWSYDLLRKIIPCTMRNCIPLTFLWLQEPLTMISFKTDAVSAVRKNSWGHQYFKPWKETLFI